MSTVGARGRRAGVVVAAILAVLVPSACAGPSAPGRSLSRLSLATSSGCPSDTPYQLPFVLQSPQDQEALGGDLVFCTDESSSRTVVANASENVWVLTDPPGLTWQGIAPTSAEAVFDLSVSQAPPGGLALVPGTSARIGVEPGQVRARLDLSYLSMWQLSKIIGDAADKKGQNAARALLGRGSPMRGAVASCAVGSFLAARTIATTDLPADRYADWITSSSGLDLAKGAGSPVSNCIKDWRAAENQIKNGGSAVPPVLVEDLQHSATQPFWRTAANRAYAVVKRFGPGVVRAVPK